MIFWEPARGFGEARAERALSTPGARRCVAGSDGAHAGCAAG
jgi:hypothetical protein